MTLYNPNINLVDDYGYAKFCLIPSIRSQDIERKPNLDGLTEPEAHDHNAYLNIQLIENLFCHENQSKSAIWRESVWLEKDNSRKNM